MDLLVMKIDQGYRTRARFFSMGSPTFQITQNVVDNQGIANTANKYNVNGYLINTNDIANGQFMDTADRDSVSPPNDLKQTMIGFLTIQNRQFISSENAVQNLREQQVLIVPTSNNGGLGNYPYTLSIDNNVSYVEYQTRVDINGRVQVRCSARTTFTANYVTILNTPQFDSTHIAYTAGMRIPVNSITNGIIAITRNNVSTGNGRFKLVKIERIESNENLTGVKFSLVDDESGQLIDPTIYDVNQGSEPIRYYQENNLVNLLNDVALTLDNDNQELDNKITALTEEMSQLSNTMADLRKDVDEITNNNSALFVSR